MRFTGLILLLLLLVSCTGTVPDEVPSRPPKEIPPDREIPPEREVPSEPPSDPEPTDVVGVRLLSSSDCKSDVPGRSSVCHHIGITCSGIAERELQIREYSTEEPKGGVIFIGPGDGSKPYSSPAHDEGVKTVSVLLDDGFEVFEFRWWDDEGWITDVDEAEAGWKGAMCGYSSAVRWVHAELMEEPDTLCALGNSGGSMQNAYGLVYYGLDDILDMVIFTGGPFALRYDETCYDTRKKDTSADIVMMDRLQGWEGNGDHCKNSDESVKDILDKDSLLSDLSPGDYTYPTKLNFIGDVGDGWFMEGEPFFDFVDAPKYREEWPGRQHWFDMTPEGAEKVQELFLEECVDT